jgi:hypothetical protein
MGIMCLGVILLGYQFTHGRWIRFLSGNTFLPKEKLQTSGMRAYAKWVGIVSYAAVSIIVSKGICTYVIDYHSEYIQTARVINNTILILWLCFAVFVILRHPDIKPRIWKTKNNEELLDERATPDPLP